MLRNGLAAVLLATAAGATACSGGDEDDPYGIPERFKDYCAEVTSLQATLGDALDSGGKATGLIKALPSFRTLEAKAPADIADDWELVIGRVEDLVAALDDAGIDPATYDRKHPPKGLAKEQRDAIDAAAVALVSTATAEAMGSVQQQSRDVCKTPLYL